MNHCSDVIGGVTVAHASELARLGFFEAIERRTGLSVDVGRWEEVRSPDLAALVEIIDETLVQASEGLEPLLGDLREMAVSARAEGCSIAFVL